MTNDSRTLGAVRSAGEKEREFSISIGPRFLELFSENLYSSPNKAFEELVANSWDAEASAVYISIPKNLHDPEASIWVLDNGISMDADGLQTLWKITSDHKRTLVESKRPQIGKFGIGKLATYILASEISFVCKASDGIIRTVSVNYRDIEQLNVWNPERLPLTVRTISNSEFENILSMVDGGENILSLIACGIPHLESEHFVNEFHHPDPPPVVPSDTWTLVLLTSLRETGKAIQRGQVRRMLRSALPLTSDVSISLNDEMLEPTKIEAAAAATWILGRNLDIDEVELETVDTTPEKDSVTISGVDDSGYPYLTIEGINGQLSGQITLYESRISGGKSENLGASNGFFINILGRVINLDHTDFGLENLSHSAWAQFRATIRADGLDKELGVERKGLRDSRQVRIFKRFLMSTFNKARTALAETRMAEWPKAGDILDGSWKSVPMRPLAQVVSERLTSGRGLPSSIEANEVRDVERIQKQWDKTIEENPGDLISAVKPEALGGKMPFSIYRLPTRELLVNENHPYFVGRSGTIEEKKVMQDFALADFLTELYLIENNVDSVALDEGRAFRDEFLHLLAQLQRKTGPEIARMLKDAGANPTGLEVIVGDALDYIGFNVQPLGKRGEPDGVAQAPLSPKYDHSGGSYRFTYDTKSTSHSRVSNKDVRPGSLARHRRDHKANYTLVVAPDFELGALQQECKESEVTPMRSEDLADLLILSARFGNVDFVEFRKLFTYYDPDKVHSWVDSFIKKSVEKPHVSVGQLLETFDDIGIEGPDELETAVIADRIRQRTGERNFPTERDIRRAVEGLGVFLPSIVRNNNKQVYLSASPLDIRNALLEQLQLLPESMRLDIDSGL